MKKLSKALGTVIGWLNYIFVTKLCKTADNAHALLSAILGTQLVVWLMEIPLPIIIVILGFIFTTLLKLVGKTTVKFKSI